jgi:hypothetical protein
MKQPIRNYLLLVLGALPVLAAPKNEPKPLGEAAVLKSIKGPKDFDVTVFALPLNVMYPTALAATPGGELYVAIDEDGARRRTRRGFGDSAR